MNILLAIAISMVIAGLLTLNTPRPKERHHIYWCMYKGEPVPHPVIPNAYIQDPYAGWAFPCSFRKNTPVSV